MRLALDALLQAASSRDLPMPGSPESRTTRPSPAFACAQRRTSSASSSSRPTSGVRRGACSASKRLSAAPGRSTRQARTGLAKPLTASGRGRRSRTGRRRAAASRRRSPPCRARPAPAAAPPGWASRRRPSGRGPRRPNQLADDHEPGRDPDPRVHGPPAAGRAPASPPSAPARPGSPARRRPPRPAGSRNRPARRRPGTARRSRRSARPCRRRGRGRRRSARAGPRGRAASRARSSRRGRRTSR